MIAMILVKAVWRILNASVTWPQATCSPQEVPASITSITFCPHQYFDVTFRPHAKRAQEETEGDTCCSTVVAVLANFYLAWEGPLFQLISGVDRWFLTCEIVAWGISNASGHCGILQYCMVV